MSPRKNPAAVALGRRGGKVGGLVKSAAKTAAAQANGKLGGRPRTIYRIGLDAALDLQMAGQPSDTVAVDAFEKKYRRAAAALARERKLDIRVIRTTDGSAHWHQHCDTDEAANILWQDIHDRC